MVITCRKLPISYKLN
uniref:Uncharacterized protein n=1 Tax=Arundo donax TaxID=35708 RepID=A0A0A8YJN7_ARUDO